MTSVNVDIEFLDHLRSCMDALTHGSLERINTPGEKAFYYAITEMALEQLEEIINEAKLRGS